MIFDPEKPNSLNELAMPFEIETLSKYHLLNFSQAKVGGFSMRYYKMNKKKINEVQFLDIGTRNSLIHKY